MAGAPLHINIHADPTHQGITSKLPVTLKSDDTRMEKNSVLDYLVLIETRLSVPLACERSTLLDLDIPPVHDVALELGPKPSRTRA